MAKKIRKQADYYVRCDAAYERYRSTVNTTGEANIDFAIELQGYIKALVNDGQKPIKEAVAVVVDLMKLLAEGNDLGLTVTTETIRRQRATRKDCSIESLERGIEKERELPRGMIKAFYGNGRKARYNSTVEQVRKSFE